MVVGLTLDKDGSRPWTHQLLKNTNDQINKDEIIIILAKKGDGITSFKYANYKIQTKPIKKSFFFP